VTAAAPAGTGTALFGYVLALADDALVLAQRSAEWITRAPQLEEDVALANIGLDLLGQARALLTYAGEVEGAGRDEDDLAYLRSERQFRNVQLVERRDGDFAEAVARLLVFSGYQLELYRALSASADETLAAVAAKAVKEVAYHQDHAAAWTVRLGDGTDVSHVRMQAGLERVWPFVDELFDGSWIDPDLPARGVAVDPAALRPAWERRLDGVLREATLDAPSPRWHARGGRYGVHTEALGYVLAELQHVHRSHPGASW
jgi:ring-1,2-phenylacetyl-CoA epoxidase subunit PaaC